MDKSQELNATPVSSTLSGESESESTATGSLTDKVKLLTDNELKKIEAQKVEGELTIRMLQREYHEAKKNFVYSQKKLGEARKKAANQAESISQLIGVNTAIVEKFEELKNYQNEVILGNIGEAEKTSDSCKSKNTELSNALKMILQQQNYYNRLEKELADKKDIVNNDIEREIEKKKVAYANFNETLAEAKKSVENMKALLNQESINYNNVKACVEEQTKKIIQFEADEEIFQKKLKQEIEVLNQEKVKLQDFYNNNVRIFEEKKTLISQFQTELSSNEQSNNEKNEYLTNLESNKEELLKEVERKRQIANASKKMLDDNVKKIMEEKAKVNSELEIVKAKFTKTEESMQKELQDLHSKVNDKKMLAQKLENKQQDLAKIRETKMSKQKDIANADRELQNKTKEWTSELRKFEQILSDKNRVQWELESKIKKLQEAKNDFKLKLESFNKDKNDKPGNDSIQVVDISKTNKLSEINKKDSDVNYKKVPQTETPTPKKMINIFGFSDSDESEDDSHSKYSSNKQAELKTPSYKKSEYDYDSDNGSDKKLQYNRSTSDRLFDKLLLEKSHAETSNESQKGSKDEDVFKMPQPYATPYTNKKKYTPKFNKK